MVLKSRYNLGDRVVVIRSAGTCKRIKCPACEGTGRLKTAVDSITQFCNYEERYKFIGYNATERVDIRVANCRGTGKLRISERQKWGVSKDASHLVLTIGGITAIAGSVSDESRRVTYMCDQTGVGTGTSYSERDLFLSTPDGLIEANAECARRNALREAALLKD